MADKGSSDNLGVHWGANVSLRLQASTLLSPIRLSQILWNDLQNRKCTCNFEMRNVKFSENRYMRISKILVRFSGRWGKGGPEWEQYTFCTAITKRIFWTYRKHTNRLQHTLLVVWYYHSECACKSDGSQNSSRNSISKYSISKHKNYTRRCQHKIRDTRHFQTNKWGTRVYRKVVKKNCAKAVNFALTKICHEQKAPHWKTHKSGQG